MTLFALFVWKNDDPITGNVLSLTNIVDPRKPICDYKVGDVVSVRLKSFGNPEGIIGLIGGMLYAFLFMFITLNFRI